MNKSNYATKTVDQLKEELTALLKEQFSLRMQKSSGQFAHPHRLRVARRNIARVKTVLAVKQKESEKV